MNEMGLPYLPMLAVVVLMLGVLVVRSFGSDIIGMRPKDYPPGFYCSSRRYCCISLILNRGQDHLLYHSLETSIKCQ
jgi:hypothetical protein